MHCVCLLSILKLYPGICASIITNNRLTLDSLRTFCTCWDGGIQWWRMSTPSLSLCQVVSSINLVFFFFFLWSLLFTLHLVLLSNNDWTLTLLNPSLPYTAANYSWHFRGKKQHLQTHFILTGITLGYYNLLKPWNKTNFNFFSKSTIFLLFLVISNDTCPFLIKCISNFLWLNNLNVSNLENVTGRHAFIDLALLFFMLIPFFIC